MAINTEEMDKKLEEEIETPLDVSDEEFLNLSLEDLEKNSQDKDEDEDEEDDIEEDDDYDDSEASDDDSDSDDADDDTSDDSNEESEDDEEGDDEQDPTNARSKQPFKESKESKEEEKEPKSSDDIDYKAEYLKLLAPFRANNKDMQVDSVDDARTLMQMGANYNKKMAALKPNLKLIKMLDNNDLLDENKLSYLIDLDKKNPDAIAKLIKESGIDPMDIDTEEDSKYKSGTYTVNDKEVELDVVLEEIKDTPSFNQTIDIIGNKWDEKSKQILLENPEVIKIINDHVAAGVYDQINAVVERERMLGKLPGLSDIEAYKEVGDALNAQGGFTSKSESSTPTPISKPRSKKADSKLRSRKKAAGFTKATPSKKGKGEDFNPLSLSDEEFEKIAGSKYI